LTNDSWKSTLANKTLESLIAHDASFPAWHNFWIGADFTHLSLDWHRRSERIREIFSRILTFRRPSDRPVYSDVGYILLGLLLETRGQESLAQQFIQLKKEFGISKDVAIGYPESLAAQNLATSLTTGYCALRRRSLVGEVHDENAYALGGVAGHAGLFSDLGSLSLYLHGLFSSRLGDFLIQRSGDLLARGNPYAYGLQPMDGEYSRDFAGGLSLGHLGFTGTGFWYDAHRSITIIQLCNRTHKKRRDDRIKPFRREILRISERYASSL
jgi:CubicO group peptidase (beta-lactamase class C family)